MRVVILLAAAAALGPEPGRQPFSTSDVWEWRTVSDAQIHPEATLVVYVVSRADPMKDATYSNLWVVGTSGGAPRAVTEGPYQDTSPRWSPEGDRIAYITNRSGKKQIRVRRLKDGAEVEVTSLAEAPSNIAWSPDGRSIAFVARAPGKPAWSVKMPDKPAGAEWAPPPIVATRLEWRIDASGYVQPGHQHVFVVPAAGGAPKHISSGEFDHRGEPAWTPDGRTIVISAARSADAEYALDGDDIFAFDVASGSVRQLTRRSGPDDGPLVSPDGKWIAFTGNDFKLQSYFIRKLYVMSADGSRMRALTGLHDRDVASPRWSSDSRTVYFVSDDRGGSHVYAARMDGTVRQVTKAVERFGAYGTAPSFSLAWNGRAAAVRSTHAEAPDVWTFAVDRPDEPKRLTASNDALLRERALGQVEEISYDSFDGKKMQGWVMKPPGFDPSQKYPLILDIHGGPHAMYGVEFDLQRQIFAARGYVVLYVNPRGSTGYGEDFGNIIHTNYPGDDYEDLMRGVDAAVARGYVDAKRMAVTGGSGGGLLTAWIIGKTDRFAAAVSQYPVTNWITQVGTADHGYRHAAVWMKGMPWENPEQYLRHSPVFLAQNFKTPTMVITGEADLRTPMAQSEELYFALKARKVDAVLVRIPDEPHGIRGAHPSHRIAKMEHVLGWIEKYTK
jgi:dipeptidyl aminopeptidase/acylaminoacyl peptidase